MKITRLLLALLCACASTQTQAPPASPDFLYVCNQADATVTLIDTRTNTIVRTVDLKALGFSANAKPHHIAVEPDGSFWYVTLIGENKIVKLDGSDRVVAQATFETPGMLALDPNSNRMYAGRSMTAVNPPKRIGVIDRSDMSIDEIDVLFARPHAMAFDAQNQTVYTASLAVNQIAAIDAASGKVEITNLPGEPHSVMQFALSPDGSTLVAAGELSHTLLVFDVTDRMKPRLVQQIDVEPQPFDPVYTRDGRYVVLGNKAANAITIVDMQTRAVAKVLRGAGIAQPHGTAVSSDGRWVYVSNNNLNQPAGAHALHGAPSTPVQPAGPGTIVVIDAHTLEIAQIIEVGRNASGIATRTATATAFLRSVAPFPVHNESGAEYAHPFIGGFDVPRPQFIDIDGDGDLDLFVQERSNELMYFENAGTRQQARFEWRTDKYANLDIGEWNRFVDLDRDGDFDLLAEQPFSYIRYYRNDGTPKQAAFMLAIDSLRDEQGHAIFADRQNIPNLGDVDCNGRLDLFLGRVEGTITRYEQTSVSASVSVSDEPRFQFITERFEDIEIVTQFGSAHGANTMYWADDDGDGDLDLFWGDFFEPGVLLIRNAGATCETPNLRTEPAPLRIDGAKLVTSGYNVPILADIDGDRDLDVFIGVLGGAYNPNLTASDNFYFLERTDSGLALRTTRYIDGIDVGSESTVTFGDLDGDGDLDMLIGNKLDPKQLETGRLYLFRNDGGRQAPSFVLADTLDVATAYHQAPVLADIDGDGDLDLLLGTWNDGVLVFRNQHARHARFVQDTSMTIRFTRGSNFVPAVADIDGDGDVDLLVGEASGDINLVRNTGTRARPRFVLDSEAFQGINAGRRSAPALADLDGDGDLDLLIGTEAGGSAFYRNRGNKKRPKFTKDESLRLPLHHHATPAFADIDGDGDADLFTGTLGGGVAYWQATRKLED